MLKVNKIEYIDGYKLLLRFDDGVVKLIDFEKLLDGEIYEPIKDIKIFKKVKLDCGTVSWENGADFAPEFLYKKGKRCQKNQHHLL